MIESDTIKLLRECDAGVKMGVSSLGDVLDYVRAAELKQLLKDSRSEHKALGEDIQALLDRYQDEGKEPPALASAMSEVMTRLKLTLFPHESDATVADILTDGCNMGIKSLSRYLNQYPAADEASKGIAMRLIRLEEALSAGMRTYL